MSASVVATLSKRFTSEQVAEITKPLRFELDLETPCRFDDCHHCAAECVYLCTRRPKFRIV